METNEEESVRFADEGAPEEISKDFHPWKLLVADDDNDIHAVTRMALAGFRFGGQGLAIVDAYSGAQAVEAMRAEPDIAVVLMDVVMESETAGLEATELIRNQLGNHRTRIILRTGQPGRAPEETVIGRYGINDYKEKTELTSRKLTTLVHARLADYLCLADLDRARSDVKDLQVSVQLLQRERSSLELLDRLTDELQSCTGLTELGTLVANTAKLLTRAPSGAVLLVGEDDRLTSTVGAWGGLNCDSCDVSSCAAFPPFGSGGALPDDLAAPCRTTGGDALHICVPIMMRDERRGVLQIVGTSVDQYDESLPLLRTLATRAALMAANLMLHERLHALSVRDPLTGLFNRRFLTETLSIEQCRTRRHGAPFSLVFFDVDHFKQVNDHYGHQAGDTALQAFGQLLQRCVRTGDIACRYGGEEFAVVMPGTAKDAALQRAEAIRGEWAVTSVAYEGIVLPQLTVSAGVAECPAHADTPDLLLRVVDAALYAAKHNGRNRCEQAEPPAPAFKPTSKSSLSGNQNGPARR
ncbi:MAG: diguanylate cyclase [Nevskia sp.]|nr:diguanylate cyclase [Nevskia sp.]